MALFPYLVLLILSGMTLSSLSSEGITRGLVFFFKPKWEDFGKINLWLNAGSQALFSTSVGFGPVPMMGAKNEFDNDTKKWVNIISLIDTITSIWGGKKTR